MINVINNYLIQIEYLSISVKTKRLNSYKYTLDYNVALKLLNPTLKYDDNNVSQEKQIYRYIV